MDHRPGGMAGLHEHECPGSVDKRIQLAEALARGPDQRNLGFLRIAQERRQHGAAKVRVARIRLGPGHEHPPRQRLVAGEGGEERIVSGAAARRVG